jgi:hypothetical protein
VLAVFDDDREIAKEWWDRCIDPDIESIKESQLEALFRRYEDESDIQEADIVEEITVSLFEEE